MPIDPARLARIRSRLLAGLALAAVGCGGSNSQPHINEPAEHVNQPPTDPSATPADGAKPEDAAKHVNSPETAPHVNTPAPAPTSTP